MTSFIRMPMVNANDESAILVAWLAAESDPISDGQAIAEIETTKTTGEVYAPESGHLRILVAPGTEVAVGAVIAAITPTPTDPVEWPPAPSPAEANIDERRWTKKAEIMAERAGVDIAQLADQIGGTVGVAELEAHLADQASTDQDVPDDQFNAGKPLRLAIVGGGDGALQVIDIAMRRPDMAAVAILDDDPALHGRTVGDVPIVGPVESAATLYANGDFDGAVVTIGTDIQVRRRVFEAMRASEVPMVNVIDPSVVIGANVTLGGGNLIMPFCHVGPAARIGDNNVISAHANIEHHADVGSHCTFGPGVMFSGRVTVGDSVRFGMGVHVEPWISIGDEAVIASGVTVTASVPARTVAKSQSTPAYRPL